MRRSRRSLDFATEALAPRHPSQSSLGRTKIARFAPQRPPAVAMQRIIATKIRTLRRRGLQRGAGLYFATQRRAMRHRWLQRDIPGIIATVGDSSRRTE